MPLPLAITALLPGRTVEWEANDLHNLGGGHVVLGVAEEDGHPVLPPVGLPPYEVREPIEVRKVAGLLLVQTRATSSQQRYRPTPAGATWVTAHSPRWS